MPTSLSDLRTYVAQDLRDTGNATWDTNEIDALVNQGIDALADIYPKEIVQTVATVAASTYSYAAASFTNIYRLDIYSSAGSYGGILPCGTGEDANSGYELHGGVLYLPALYSLTAGTTLRAFGYGRYIQLSAASSVTDLDASGIWAVRVFCQAKAFGRLLSDRAQFQQWQSNSNNTDVTAIGLAQLWQSARAEWRDERARLRRVRKLG